MAVAMRVATMSSLSNPTTAGESDSFMRKLILLLLLVINTVLGIVLWFQVDREPPLLLTTFFADATLGLVAGFGSRIVYRKWNPVAQYLVTVLSVVAGMILLGALTKSVLGIGPFGVQREAVDQIRRLGFDSTLPSQLQSLEIDPKTLIDFSKMEVSDVAHLAVSLLLAVMALQAWRSTRQVIEVEPLGHSQIEVEPRDVGVSFAPERSNGSGSRQPVSWFRSPGGGATPTPRIRSKNRIKPMSRNEAKSPRRSRSRRKSHIQLAVVEEHRCPYCLDPVSRNDARGVKECEVCHTLHHADCWAITGFCQVPHLNS
jgi:ribosomal protein L37AE/L43A